MSGSTRLPTSTLNRAGRPIATVIAASYERVSTRTQGQHGFSLGAQHQSIEEFVRAQDGWVLPEHLRFRDGEDIDASGTDWDLPDLNRMLEAARRREFQILVVPDFDRFARSLAKGLVLEEQLKKHGVRVVFQRVPVEDTPEGNLLKTQLYAFAEYDRQKIVLRTTMGRRAKAQSGKVVGAGVAPHGLRYVYETLSNGKRRVCGLEPDPATAPIARDVLLSLRTRSTLDVAADLNDRGVAGPRGGQWNATTLRCMAVNPVYRGEWIYARRRAGIAVPVAPILTCAEWDEIQAALAGRRFTRRGRQPVEVDPYILRGRLTCGHCRGVMRTMTNQGIRYYACGCFRPSDARRLGKAPCDLPATHAVDLEAELWRLLCATLLDPDYLAAGLAASVECHADAGRLRQDRLSAIDAELARQRKRLDGLAGRLVDIGEGEIFAALLRQAKEIEDLIGRLSREQDELAAMRADGLSAAEADTIVAFAAEVRAGIATATPADRRKLYDLLKIRGSVSTDPVGVRLGRIHRYRVDWQAAILLRNSGQSFLKSLKT